MKIGEFDLVNEAKLDRAINGSITRGGVLSGGVGQDATDEQILAAYDKLGGLILKNGAKVKSGCFWDADTGKPHETVDLEFELSLDNTLVNVTEEEAVAINVVKKKKEDLKKKLKDKPKGKQLRRVKKEVKE